MLLLHFIITSQLLFGRSFALKCYDSDSFVGEERTQTEVTCDYDTAVCQYRESKQIDGAEQDCSIPSRCYGFGNDTNFWKNVICCATDLCNAPGYQPPVETSKRVVRSIP
jgi:hypothetical protein